MHYSESPTLAEAYDLDAISDQRIRERSVKPPIHSPRPSSLRNERVVSDRPSVGGRAFRSFTRFFVAVLFGVGGTLAWQSHGNAMREMVVAQAPALAWLLSVSTTSPALAATSSDPVQQLTPLASNLDAVRRSVEQLAARQEQMAQNIAKLQAVEEDIRQTVSSPAPSIPQQKPPQPKAQSSAVQSSSVPGPPPPARPLLLSR